MRATSHERPRARTSVVHMSRLHPSLNFRAARKRWPQLGGDYGKV